MTKTERKELIKNRVQALTATERVFAIGKNYSEVSAVAEIKKGHSFLNWLFSDSRPLLRSDIARRRSFDNAEQITWAGSHGRDGREFSHARQDRATAAETADRQSAPSLLNTLLDRVSLPSAQTDGAACDGDNAGADFDAGKVESPLAAQEHLTVTIETE